MSAHICAAARSYLPLPPPLPPPSPQAAGDITYSIVRPTAFFKSIAGQIDIVKKGNPYVMFGDGNLAACKPISEADLASFIADCVTEQNKVNKVRGCLRVWMLGRNDN